MSTDHRPQHIERHCDVAVVGASAAGLGAALQLGRQRRAVIVIDAGEPRNAPAVHLHGYLGLDGAPPSELTDTGRGEVRRYGGEVLDGRVEDVTRCDDGRFRLGLVGGHAIVARRVVVAGEVTAVSTGPDGTITHVAPRDREPVATDAVVVGPRFRVRAEPFSSLGLTPVPHPIRLGEHLETDAAGLTAVPGVYAAGNVTDPSQQVLHAAAHGSRVGAMVSFDLAEEDARDGPRPSANEADWDHRYRDRPMWSGNPNGTLVAEVEELAPGRALDVGAGEGADAIWLAERGWTVTANDIFRGGLDRGLAEAERRGLTITPLVTDANAPDAFAPGGFDLVSAQYASIPRTADDRAIANLLDAVAPGGTLLVVSHDLAPMRTPIDTTTASRAFDPDAYVRVEDVAAALVATPGWDIEIHETRLRPPGAASASHHVDDVILRARRSD